MIKHALLATTLLLLPSLSLAADLAVHNEAPVVPVEKTFTWSGFYVGGYLGGSFAKNKLDAIGGSTDVSLSPGGFTGGGLAGFNYQLGSAVLGVEGEFGYDGWKKGSDYLNARGGERHATSEGNYIGRLRARVGYAIDDWLIYEAGGLSFADDKVTQTNPGRNISNSISKDRVGWNVGVGAERALTTNLIGRLEYIYDDFGKKAYDFQSLPGTFADRKVSLSQSTVRVALEYKF